MRDLDSALVVDFWKDGSLLLAARPRTCSLALAESPMSPSAAASSLRRLLLAAWRHGQSPWRKRWWPIWPHRHGRGCGSNHELCCQRAEYLLDLPHNITP